MLVTIVLLRSTAYCRSCAVLGALSVSPARLQTRARLSVCRRATSPVDHVGRLLRRLGVYDVKLAAGAEDDRAIGCLPRTQLGNLRGRVALSGAPGDLKVLHVDIYAVIAAERS